MRLTMQSLYTTVFDARCAQGMAHFRISLCWWPAKERLVLVRLCIHMQTYIHTHTRTHTHTRESVRPYILLYMYIYIYVHIYIRM
jgi:hypothetical protein